MSQGAPAFELPAAVLDVDGQVSTWLETDFELCRCNPGEFETPADADAHGRWQAVPALSTVAAIVGPGESGQLDDHDFWFRRRLPTTVAARALIEFGGLATIASIYIDGELRLASESMFRRHVLDVSSRTGESKLHIRCAALTPILKRRRPRPRWPSKIVAHKNLRFIRTSMLGRMPGILPRPAPVGPHRPVRLVTQTRLAIDSLRIVSTTSGNGGRVRLTSTVVNLLGGTVEGGVLRVAGREATVSVVQLAPDRFQLQAELSLPDVERWWPHTHGHPTRHRASLELRLSDGSVGVTLRPVAFRDIERTGDSGDGGFGLRVNGEPIFARGACWMPLDPVGFRATEARYRAALKLVLDGGMNMLRLSGISVYEAPIFHDLCDELGILVWQDFMFANLDYPAGDEGFMEQVHAEVAEVLEQLADRPSTAVLCGNSEAEQQAAMMGLTSANRAQPLFEDTLRGLCESHTDVPYWPSTPHGGTLPFRTDLGTTHYYGVGAYGRSMDSLRTANVRFTPECLAFSQLPDGAALEGLGPGDVFDSPDYRTGMPRDVGASWNFGDVTENYTGQLFGVDAQALRRTDPGRHLAFHRRVPGMLMAEAQGVWRRQADPCQGALVWTLNDLLPGAGWGLLAHDGSPKAGYYALKRMWAPRALWFVEEGLNGLSLWLANDRPDAWKGTLEVRLVHAGGRALESASRQLEVAPRHQLHLDVEGLLDCFVDPAHAYRFGPASHVCVWARFGSGDEPQAFHFVERSGGDPRELGLRAEARVEHDGYVVTVTTERPARSVRVEARGYLPSDNYFDVAPGEPHRLSLIPTDASSTNRELHVELHALNASASCLATTPRTPHE